MNDRIKVVNDITNDLGRVMRDHLDFFTKTCINCSHFSETPEMCNKFNARPPARVIAFGCEHYKDQIPF